MNNVLQNLSLREVEIVECLSKGMTSKEIAENLFLSNHTVDTHRRNILKKTTAKNTAQLLQMWFTYPAKVWMMAS
ncbi:MAG: helix-turn-helix transcriptional regulator [Cyclobacteriaceae bacterium]